MAVDDSESVYWATKPQEELGTELVELARSYYTTLESAGVLDLYSTVTSAFYGLSSDGSHETSKIVEFGEDGEKLGMRSNQLRSLVRHVYNMATAERPAVKPMAANGTAKALAQIPTARRVLDYYHKTKHLELHLRGAVLRALLYGKGYLWQMWDPTAGRMVEAKPPADGLPPGDGVMPSAGPKPEGDLIYRACSPKDMVCDLDRDAHDHDWYIARRKRNRYDQAAIFAPTDETLRALILSNKQDCVPASAESLINSSLTMSTEEGDVVYEYHFMHRRTPALEMGRYCILLGDGTILFDGPLPYDGLTVDEIVPEEFIDCGSLGYASAWDLLGMQQAYDGLLSVCITNLDAFGFNDVLIPDGVELGVEEIRDGLNVIRYPAGEHNKPSVLEKFSIKEEAFKLRDWLKADMQLSSGVNGVARGEPEASLKSGTALALIQAQAVHFQSPVMAAYAQLVEASSTTTLKILRAYADMPRIASIAGANDPDGLAAFTGSDISDIERVVCEQVNPVFKTLAGKFDIANNLLERGLLKDIGQYYQVLETGRLETATDGKRQENLYWESVKEALMKGPSVIPAKSVDPMTGQPYETVDGVRFAITDHPVLALMAAKHVMDSIENRKNEQVMLAATTYALEVMRIWRGAPKDLLTLLGYPLPPPLPGDPMMPPGGGAEQAGDKPPGGKPTGALPGKPSPPSGTGEQPDQNPPDEGSGMPSLPKPATPPATPKL